ncbi:MFS transporter [Sphingomonas sp. MMS24-J13]|uniref:MFS transporter n=1 Tax=Sphingomonas sp. MMS24-J13 TaxID=3238686 RepID=UPI00384E7E9E
MKAHAQPAVPPAIRRGYENRMVAVTSVVVGVVAMDRLAVGLIAPYLTQAFSLSNTQLGALYAVQALAAAVGGFAAARVSDATGWRKQIIVLFLCLAAVFATTSAIASGFLVLLGVRLLLGASEGPVAALCQSVTSLQSSANRRGLNLGVLTLAMIFVSQVFGPILLTRLADHWSWRAAFFAPVLPMLLMGGVAALVLRNVAGDTVPRPAPGIVEEAPAPPPALARNAWICGLISMVFMSWLVVHSTFLPLYLVKERGLSPGAMAMVMSVVGVSGCIGGLLLPALSDRWGRRRTMVAAMLVAAVVPIAILSFHGSAVVLAAILFVGWLGVGALPIYTAVIPGESVAPGRAATVIAAIMAAGELVGGVAGPLVAGSVADRFGLVTPFWFTAGAALLCCLLALTLTETRMRQRSAA